MSDSMTHAEALELTLAFTDKGVACFPIEIFPHPAKPGRLQKAPLTRNGHLDASADPDVVRSLFRNVACHRDGDLGVAMVPASIGAVTFDLDRHEDGQDGVAYGLNVLHLPPHTYMQHTATGGLHALYAKRDAGVVISNANPWNGHGIDVRSDNGYIVAAGTRTRWGSWTAVDGKPDISSLAMVPLDKWDELIEAGQRSSASKATAVNGEPVDIDSLPQALSDLLADTTVPDRSKRWHHIVGECKGAGLTQGQAVTLLAAWDRVNGGKYTGRIEVEVARSWGKVTDPVAWVTEGGTVTADPRRWITKDDGLLVADLANAISSRIPMMRDRGDTLWTYRGGVWQPDHDDLVRTAVSTLLGNKTRNAHTNNVRHYLLGSSRVIEARPVPEYLNVRNGLLDWQSGDLREHDPAVPSTVQLGAIWRPEATCPTIESWLSQVLPSDLLAATDESPGFIWEVLGYLCFSGNPLHKAVLLLGYGRNGKGTFLRLVTELLGRENVSAVDLHSLVTNRFRAAELFGKVANIAGDLDSSWLESTAVFKAITGGDTIPAERKYGQPFDFTPFAVPVYSANKVFGTPDTTDGYMSRWVVIPFPNTFLGAEDRGLDHRLQDPDEVEGMLVKAVEGLRALMARGNFTTPASVAEAFARFADESDPVRAFMRDVSEADPDGWVERTKVWDVYRTWAADNGHRSPLSRNALYSRVESAGWPLRVRKGARGFIGRTLTVDIVETGVNERHLEPRGVPEGAEGAEGAEPSTPGPACGGKGEEIAPIAPPAPRKHKDPDSDPTPVVPNDDLPPGWGDTTGRHDPWPVAVTA